MHTSTPVSASTEPTPAASLRGPRSVWVDVLVRLRRSRSALVGGVLLAALIAAALAAPLLTPYEPLIMNPVDRLQPPNAHHIFGTDVFGRDLATRMLFGSRISLQTGLISVTIAVALGVPMGLASGFYGGSVDRLLMRLVDLMLTFPGILLALVIIAILGPNLRNAMLAVGISASPTYARVVRAAVLSAKEQT
jgi:peptide/nickel transport system permease protein